MNILALTIVSIATLASIVFVALYSRVRWEESREGRNAMMLSVSILVLGISAIFRLLLDNKNLELGLLAFGWTLAAAVVIARIRLFLIAQAKFKKQT